MSLKDLHTATGLSKATLTRILVTLLERGLVWQRIADGAYLPGYSLYEYAHHCDEEHRLVEISSPVLEALGRHVRWPSVLAVPRINYMEVIETNCSRAYFDHIPLGPIGYRVDILQSAAGRTFLAFCSQAERDAILARLDLADRTSEPRVLLERILKEARQRGYGAREPKFSGFGPRASKFPEDGRYSMAVPISVNDHAIGCINLTWTAKFATVAEMADRHLDDLREAADGIAVKLVAARSIA